ncbi:hypothetical protein SAMN03159293_01792 [Pseudomonas sp. NFACC39-1]|nr:hypothetical protein SAMN03159293_01792 [Pseudomonas sp. NFACC39-1]
MGMSRWGSVLALSGALATSAYAADAQKTFTQGGGNPAAIACSTCHSADGTGMPESIEGGQVRTCYRFSGADPGIKPTEDRFYMQVAHPLH